MPWDRSVVYESTALTTTGGVKWDASVYLCDYLEDQCTELGLDQANVRILELGSGCGWLGMILARNLPEAKSILVTEQAAGGGLDWLKHNLSLNESFSNLRAIECDWRWFAGEGWQNKFDAATTLKLSPSTQVDFLLGADLIYSEEGVSLLPLVFRQLAGKSTKIVYAHTKRRYEVFDHVFGQRVDLGKILTRFWPGGSSR